MDDIKVEKIDLNPVTKTTGDCLIQCILKLEGLPSSCWKSVYADLYNISSLSNTVFNSSSTIMEYLNTRCSITGRIDYKRYWRRDVNGDDEDDEYLTLKDFVIANRDKLMLIGIPNHIVLLKDGVVYDSEAPKTSFNERVLYSYEVVPKTIKFAVGDVVWIPDLRTLRGIGLAIVTSVTEQNTIKKIFTVSPDIDKNRKQYSGDQHYVLDFEKDLDEWEKNITRKTGLTFEHDAPNIVYDDRLKSLIEFNDIIHQSMARRRDK